ncbi:MAG: hypothetical protein LUD47_04980 [Clostridia bacterium]|nr:hypothetical protein [Clostridia bacterium]
MAIHLENVKWYPEDRESNLIDLLQNAEAKEIITLSDGKRQKLECRKIDVLEMYRRVYAVLKVDEPVDYLPAPTSIVFRLMRENGEFYLELEKDTKTTTEVLDECVIRTVKGDKGAKSFEHIFPKGETGTKTAYAYEMLLSVEDNPEGIVEIPDAAGRKHQYGIVYTAWRRRRLYCILTRIMDKKKDKHGDDKVYYVDETDGEPKFTVETDKKSSDDIFGLYLDMLDGIVGPAFNAMLKATDPYHKDDYYEDEDNGNMYICTGCREEIVEEEDEDGDPITENDILKLLDGRELLGPIMLMPEDDYGDNLDEEKIAAIEYEGDMYLISEPIEVRIIDRTVTDENGEKQREFELDYHELGGTDIFKIDKGDDSSELIKSDDAELKYLLYDEYLTQIMSDDTD